MTFKKETYDDEDPVEEDLNWLIPGLYCLTINPGDSIQYPNDSNRIKKVRAKIYDILLDFPETHIRLEVELSTPNSNKKIGSFNNKHFRYPRVHFHGFLELKTNKSVKYFLEHGMYALMNCHVFVSRFKEINGKPDITGWVTYITKQSAVMQEKTMIMDRAVDSTPKAKSLRQQMLGL